MNYTIITHELQQTPFMPFIVYAWKNFDSETRGVAGKILKGVPLFKGGTSFKREDWEVKFS